MLRQEQAKMTAQCRNRSINYQRSERWNCKLENTNYLTSIDAAPVRENMIPARSIHQRWPPLFQRLEASLRAGKTQWSQQRDQAWTRKLRLTITQIGTKNYQSSNLWASRRNYKYSMSQSSLRSQRAKRSSKTLCTVLLLTSKKYKRKRVR